MTEQERLGNPGDNNPSNEDIEKMTEALREMARRGAPQQEDPEKAREGLVGGIREKIRGVANESGLPNEDYESTVGVYGGKMKIEDGKMVWDNTGFISGLDMRGDALVRIFDEHVVKEPGKLLRKHPKIALKKFFAPGTKRYRGNNEEIMENVERLGLSECYGPHKNGIEIRKPEIYTNGLALQDVCRSDLIKSESGDLEKTDRFQALAEASKYVKEIHDKHGGIGELLVSDIIFQENEDGKLGNPVLNLPDIVWNKKKKTSETDKKTTDLLDFLFSVFGEETRRSQNPEDVAKALDTILDNYGDRDATLLVESFVKRGRITLQGDAEVLNLPNTITRKTRKLFAQHNKARLSSKTGFEGEMKEKVVDACERFLTKNPKEE